MEMGQYHHNGALGALGRPGKALGLEFWEPLGTVASL